MKDTVAQDAVELWLNPRGKLYLVNCQPTGSAPYETSAVRLMRSGALLCYDTSPGGITTLAIVFAPGKWLMVS